MCFFLGGCWKANQTEDERGVFRESLPEVNTGFGWLLYVVIHLALKKDSARTVH